MLGNRGGAACRKAIGAQDNISGLIPAALGAAGEGSGGPAPEPPPDAEP